MEPQEACIWSRHWKILDMRWCRVAAPAPTLWVWWLDCGLPSPGRGRAAVISPAADKMCQNYFPIIQQMKLTKNIIEWPCWYIINEEGKPGPVPGLSWHKPSRRAAAVSSPPPPGPVSDSATQQKYFTRECKNTPKECKNNSSHVSIFHGVTLLWAPDPCRLSGLQRTENIAELLASSRMWM